MQIRQISLQYHPEEDRLLLRVRAADAQAFAVWLTRRLTQHLWPHWSLAVRQLGVAQALKSVDAARPSSGATLMPEAQAMLADSARKKALDQADFSQPYDTTGATQPLGAEPMLPAQVQLTPEAQGTLKLSVRDARGRHVELGLTAPMAIAVHELMRAALAKAQWGFGGEPDPTASDAAAPGPPRVLN